MEVARFPEKYFLIKKPWTVGPGFCLSISSNLIVLLNLVVFL